MIIARELNKEKDKHKLETFVKIFNSKLTIEDILSNDLIYIMQSGEKIVGITAAMIYDDKSLLNLIIINKEERNSKLGDGLLRSILNKLEKEGIKKVYSKVISEFLIKEGFKKVKPNTKLINDLSIKENTDILECNLETFFSKCCNE
ncbi:MAG: GNAT family N-acetyltransferase [Firmicutes bacterium]|nr:GNAT family N-acetyltransferase [Bacillota bacterium]